MPIYSIEAPNGKIFKVEAPEGVSGEDVLRDFDTNLFPQWMAANKPKEQSIMGSLQAGLAQPLGALGTTAETLGLTGTGAALKGVAEYITPEGYESAAGRFITPQEGDVTLGGFGIGSLPAAVAEQSGQIAGAIGTRFGGAAVGAAIGSAILPGPGTVIGGAAGAFLGPFLFEALQILGPVAQERAQKEGREAPNASDIGAAALTAAGSGALNALGAKYLPGGGQAAAPLLKRMGEGLVGEGGTELLQSILEQTGSSLGTEAGLDISGKQAIAEGILGGVAGGATSGAFGRRPEGPRPPTDYESLRADIEAARTPTEQDLIDTLKGPQGAALPPPPPAAAEAAAAAEEISGAPSRPRLTVEQPVLEGGVSPTEAITADVLPPSIGAPTAANRPGVMGRAIEEPYVPQTEEEIRLQEQRQTMADTGMLPTVKTGPITREGRPVELRAEGAAAPLTPEIAIPMGAPKSELDALVEDTIKEPVSKLEGAPDEKALATIPRLRNWVAGNGGILLDKTTMGEYGKDVFRQGRAVFRTKYVAPSTAARMSNRVARPEEDVVKNAKESGWLGPAARARFNNGEAVTAEDTETFRALLSKDITSGPMDGVYEPDALAALAEKGPTKEALTEDTKRAVEGAIADAEYQDYPDEAYNDAVRRLVEGREDDPVVAVNKAIINHEKVRGERDDTARRKAADDLNRLVFTDKMPLDNEAMTFAYDQIIKDPTLDPKATYTAALKTKARARAEDIPFDTDEPVRRGRLEDIWDTEFSRAGGKRKSKKAKAKARAAKTAAQQPPTSVVEPVKTITAADKAAAMQRIDDAIKKLAGDDTDQGRNLAIALKRAIADRKISVDQVLQAFKMSETVMRLLSGVTGAQKIKFAANLFGTFPDPENPGDFLADVEVGGTRSAYRQLIELSLNPDYNPLETTSHEIWHSLEDAFAASDRATGRIINAAFKGATKIDEINPNLLRVLKNTRNPMMGDKVSLYDTLMSRDIDAAVAEETSQFQKERELKAYVFGLLDQARQNNVQIGGLGSAFVRFVNFVKSVRESVGNLLRGQGFTTVEEAFAGVSAGVAQRGLNTGQKTSGPEYSRAKNVSDFVEKNIGFDNPATSRPKSGGIEWLQNKIEAAEKAMSRNDRETAAGKGLIGSTTAWTPKEMNIPLDILKNLKGGWNEKPAPGDTRYDRLSKKVQEEGWNPDAIHISVNHLGVPYITHGNTRRAVANALGKSVIPATISWFNGAENVPGEWSADGFAKQILSSLPASTEFSRASNFSRIGMPHTKILDRDSVLEENVAKLEAGEITPDQWDALVRQRKPVELYDIENIPVPATPEQAVNALYENKQDKYGLAKQYYKEGDPVKLRLDIPAYAREDGKNAWVNAIHDGSSGTQTKKPTVYESVSAATDVTFSVTESAALATAKGAGKAPYATMRGGFKPITPKEAYAKAKQVHTDPAWVQVGMDPTRHSFFYTRGDMKPVVAAEEVLQIGPLVYAKNPTYAGRSDFEFSRVKVPPNVANAPNAAAAQVNSTRWSNITDTVKEFFDPWAFIDNAPVLRSFRNLLVGKIGTANELGQKIANDIAKGSTADSGHNGNVYKFLTTRNASPSMIVDPEVRKAAILAKEEINKQGKRLVAAGFMTQESLDKNYDQYVPRLYMYYEATGRGMKTPNMGLSTQEYLKLRDDQLSVEERELLGEIKNPAFLAYVAIARPARDMALAQYFADIGTTSGVKWVLDDSVINWKGKMVSPFWMASEIKLMKTVTLPFAEQTDPARAAIVRKEIANMEKLINKIPGYGPESKIPDGYQRLPDTPRYGVLRGAVIQKGIYDDLVGTFAMVPNTNQSMIGKILGDEQSLLVNANKVWKLGKVTFNIPSQARNVISNVIALNVFGGIPLSRLPKALSAAAKSWSSKDQYWKEAQEYGIQGGTMAAAELKIMFNTMNQYQARGDKNNFFGAVATGRIAAKYLLSKPGEFYQNMEVLFKMALFIENRKNNKTVSESVDAAHDSLFDYTMVNPNIRWLRNAPLGLPFITYYYKVLPKLIQTARENPLRFAPYIMLAYALPQIAMAQLDWEDEDYEAARKLAADYMRDKGSMYILPWKDSNGKIQMVDLGYFFPWAAFTDPIVTAAWYGEPVKGLKQLGGQFVPGGPLITAIAVMTTGRDPLTDKQVVNPLDTVMNQFFSGLSYAWNQALPPMLNVDLNNMDNSGGAIPRIYNSLFTDGTGTDKRGMAKPDTLATAARLFGFNITPLDVVKQRAQNINYMLNTIHKREAYRAQIAKDQSMTPEKRRAEIQDLNVSIRKDYLKIQKYATETARATKLED